MSEARVVPSIPTRNDLGTNAMNVDADHDETQVVMELEGGKRQGDGVSKEMVADAAQIAVDNVMSRNESQRQSLGKGCRCGSGWSGYGSTRPNDEIGNADEFADASADAKQLGICREKIGEQNRAA